MRLRRAWARPAALLAAAAATLLGSAVPADAATGGAGAATGAVAAGATTTAVTASERGWARDAAGEDGELEVEITDVAPAVLRPGDTLTVSGTLANNTDEDLAKPDLDLSMQRATPISRSTLQRWLEPGSAFSLTRLAGEELPEDLAAGARATFSLEVPAEELPFGDASAWGPRGIEVRAGDGDVDAAARSFVLWYPDADVERTPVGVLAPVAPTAEERTAAGPGGDVTEAAADRLLPLLEALDQPGVTAAVDGMLLDPATTDAEPAGEAATADPGAPEPPADGAVAEEAPGPGTRVRDAVTALAEADQREVVALPWADADVAALAHAGRADLLADARARTQQAVTAAGLQARTDIAWPAGAVPDQQTVELAAATGAAAVVLPGSAMTPERDLTYTPAGRADVPLENGSTLPTVLVDQRVSAVLTGRLLPRVDAAGEETVELAPVTARQLLLAETAVVARERPSDPRALVLALPRDFDGDAAALGETLAALAAAPWVEPTTVSELGTMDSSALARRALPEQDTFSSEVSAAVLAGAGEVLERVRDFATITADPEALVVPYAAAVAPVVSAAWRADPDGRSAYLARVARDAEALDSRVEALPSSTVNLINSSAHIPIHVRNDLDVDVRVQVALEPTDPRLQARETVPLSVPANSEATAQVPVRAVGSGDVPVDVLLLAPGGGSVGTSTTLQVRVRADWENVGTAVVAGVLAVLLVVGIARTARRGPRMDPNAPLPDPEA
ncbi:DUF6049 family protein [Georgenia sp. AZ-5]|uniref:DUF6049 family protein n=1 Tax=Georgenia sp. AZ-5 TaxID=3367526 RepID=UPI003754E186